MAPMSTSSADSTTTTTTTTTTTPWWSDSVREAAAGALAGAASKTAMAPLDRLKLVVQLRGSIASTTTADASYGGPWRALSKMIQEEGWLALWRGNTSTILIQGGTSALNFVFMDWYKRAALRLVQSTSWSSNDTPNYPLAQSLVAGALTGGSAITLLYPIGLIRTQLALDVVPAKGAARKFPRGMRDVLQQSLATPQGFASLYKGYGVALWSVSLYRMVHLGGYDYLKTYWLLPRHVPQQEAHQPKTAAASDPGALVPFGERLVAAQFVSMLASTIHYPLDSIRRRLMMQSTAASKAEQRYRNAWDCFIQIYRQEGIAGYYRGLGTNYLRSVSGAMLLVSYDFFKTLLN